MEESTTGTEMTWAGKGHSKGPFKIFWDEDGCSLVAVDRDGNPDRLVAWVPGERRNGEDNLTYESDAHLFKAAGDMLRALEGLIADESPEFIPTRLWNAARAAVAKAKGETQ